MNMKNRFIISFVVILFLLIGVFTVYILGNIINIKDFRLDVNNNNELCENAFVGGYTIQEINNNFSLQGKLNVNGYLIYKTGECPPCQATSGAVCSDCLQEIVISEENSKLEFNYNIKNSVDGLGNLTDREIVISYPNSDDLDFGKLYLFRVNINRYIYETGNSTFVELLNYCRLRD